LSEQDTLVRTSLSQERNCIFSVHIKLNIYLARCVEEAVGRSCSDISEYVGGAAVDEGVLDLLGGVGGVPSQHDRSSAGDVGGGHAGARDGSEGVVCANPSGSDGGTRREDIYAGAPVAERGSIIFGSSSAYSNRARSVGGGVVAGVPVVVTSSDSVSHTCGDGVLYGAHEGRGFASPERHVGDGKGASAAGVCVGDPIDTSDDTRGGS